MQNIASTNTRVLVSGYRAERIKAPMVRLVRTTRQNKYEYVP